MEINLDEILFRVRRALHDHKIKEHHFAKLTGIQHTALSLIMKGKTKPSFDSLQKILAGVKVLEEDLPEFKKSQDKSA